MESQTKLVCQTVIGFDRRSFLQTIAPALLANGSPFVERIPESADGILRGADDGADIEHIFDWRSKPSGGFIAVKTKSMTGVELRTCPEFVAIVEAGAAPAFYVAKVAKSKILTDVGGASFIIVSNDEIELR
uniref:Uncharacterized protein n=1 Tax=Marseillevirus LCMAC103 TaxID=2506604 RepID=A0A481YUW0_9VIRU|nr:MAG: hypothetical protein LCMAC103_03220 [Marseillevirus LCMAC103]